MTSFSPQNMYTLLNWAISNDVRVYDPVVSEREVPIWKYTFDIYSYSHKSHAISPKLYLFILLLLMIILTKTHFHNIYVSECPPRRRLEVTLHNTIGVFHSVPAPYHIRSGQVDVTDRAPQMQRIPYRAKRSPNNNIHQHQLKSSKDHQPTTTHTHTHIHSHSHTHINKKIKKTCSKPNERPITTTTTTTDDPNNVVSSIYLCMCAGWCWLGGLVDASSDRRDVRVKDTHTHAYKNTNTHARTHHGHAYCMCVYTVALCVRRVCYMLRQLTQCETLLYA